MPAFGRGGAGNLAQQPDAAQQMTEMQSRDVEANKPNAQLAALELARAEAEAQSRKKVDAYAHTGRGGSGNWYSPKELATGGSFVNTSDTAAVPSNASASKLNNATSIAGTVTNVPIASGGGNSVMKSGRGGAGNFDWSNEAAKAEELATKEREAAIQQDILRNIDTGLAKPGRVVLKHETAKE